MPEEEYVHSAQWIRDQVKRVREIQNLEALMNPPYPAKEEDDG